MASKSARTVVLLPIQPQYAAPIMEGKKRVEFRKRTFRRDVSHIVVYSSSPVMKVVGFFEISGIDEDSPAKLWKKYEAVGGISRQAFRSYFDELRLGVAIKVGAVHVLEKPIALKRVLPKGRAPQSFQYLDSSVLSKLRQQ